MSQIKNILIGTILSCCIFAAYASVWRAPSKSKTVCNDGKCEEYCDYEDYLIKPGESFKTKDCSEIHCNDDFSIFGESCGIYHLDGCQLLPDYTKTYPECCGQICKETGMTKDEIVNSLLNKISNNH